MRVQGEPIQSATLAERMLALKVPGLAVAVFDEAGVVWAKVYGLADVESREQIFKATATVFPALPRAHAAVGAALATAGRHAEAVQAYETALERLAEATWLPPREREDLVRRIERDLVEEQGKVQH